MSRTVWGIIFLTDALLATALIHEKQVLFLVLMLFSQLLVVSALVSSGARATHNIELASLGLKNKLLIICSFFVIIGVCIKLLWNAHLQFDQEAALASATSGSGEALFIFAAIIFSSAAVFSLAMRALGSRGGVRR